jgi:hypothetical protein
VIVINGKSTTIRESSHKAGIAIDDQALASVTNALRERESMRMLISRSSSANSQFSRRFVCYYHYKLLAFFRLT